MRAGPRLKVSGLTLERPYCRQFFAELHKMYVNAMANPFAAIGERLTSPGFDKKVQALVKQQTAAT